MTERGNERLGAVIQRLQRAFVANGPQSDAELADASRLAERAARRAALERAGHPLPITTAMHDAIVLGTLSRTYALNVALGWHKLAKPDDKTKAPSRPILVLHGLAGSGKSVAAAAVLAQVPGARWASSRTLLECYTGSFGEVLQRRAVLQTSSLLVLDGIGDERPDRADAMSDALLDMLAHRVHRRTIVTTRLLMQPFEKRYSSTPLASLFVESAELAPIPTHDMRKGGLP